MFISAALALVATAATALAAPLETRSTYLTGQYTCATSGDYQLCQNQWGTAEGVGSQNSTLISTYSNCISWSTSYTWANNPNDVKTYANVLYTTTEGPILSSVTSIPTQYDFTYADESSGLRADVSYDMWLGNTTTAAPASTDSKYEIMIWLSGLGGIQPVGSLLTSDITLQGYSWNLWYGPNTNWEVYSFIPSTAGNQYNGFDEDILPFFKYLVEYEAVSDSLYLNAIQTGTEAFTGNATLDITNYCVAINT